MDLYHQEIDRIAKMNLPWELLRGKTMMLSGATGMVGKSIIDLIMHYNEGVNNQDEEIRVIALSRSEDKAKERLALYWDRSSFVYKACDVNIEIPECGNVDYIIHAASNTHPLQYSMDSIGTITSNIIGNKNLLDYAVTHKTRQFCFVSSVEVYGENRGDVEKFDEKYLGYIDCNTLRAGYPESKRLGETLCNAYKQTYGLDFVVPRLSRCYGPTMLLSDTKAISQFIKKAVAGEDIVLKSDGTQMYSYTFVTDAVSAILQIMLCASSGEAYNVADKESDIALKDLAGYLAAAAGVKVIFELPDEAEKRGYSTATKAMLNSDKLEMLGWEARVHMQEGLKCTIEMLQNM